MSSCCTLRLKRRKAFSRDSPSCSRISANETHPQTRPDGRIRYYKDLNGSQVGRVKKVAGMPRLIAVSVLSEQLGAAHEQCSISVNRAQPEHAIRENPRDRSRFGNPGFSGFFRCIFLASLQIDRVLLHMHGIAPWFVPRRTVRPNFNPSPPPTPSGSPHPHPIASKS